MGELAHAVQRKSRPAIWMEVSLREKELPTGRMGDTIEVWANETGGEPFMNSDEFGLALEQLMAPKSDDTHKPTSTNE